MTGQGASEATHRSFERYLDQQHIRWEPIPVGRNRSPDYRLSSGASHVLCEVKTIVGRTRHESGGYDPCRAIVLKINKARPQLDGGASEPRALVLHSQSPLYHLEPATVACAAFGPGFKQLRPDYSIIDGSPPALKFSRRKELPEHLWHLSNPALSPAHNTRISALIILQDYALSDRNLTVWRHLEARQNAGELIPPGESLRVAETEDLQLPSTFRYRGAVRTVVLENPYARIPFPEDLCRGSFDQRWQTCGEFYGPVWVGSTLDELYAEGVPFQML
jgi:hypothetical protein